MSILKEFKQFAIKGNVMDLAVAVIIGGAFGKIVTSLVNDIVMPLFGAILGGVKFTELKLNLGKSAVLTYGNFIQSIVDFLIISTSIFLMIRLMNKFKKNSSASSESSKKPGPSNQEKLLAEIRDLLKNRI